jgi:hypothetical protein
LAMSKPIVVIICMARSSESWEPQQRPHPWHRCAGGGAVHSIKYGQYPLGTAQAGAGSLLSPKHGPAFCSEVGGTGGDRAGHGISGNVTRLNNEGVGGAFPLKETAPARGRLEPSLGAVPGLERHNSLTHHPENRSPFSPGRSECLRKVGNRTEATNLIFVMEPGGTFDNLVRANLAQHPAFRKSGSDPCAKSPLN